MHQFLRVFPVSADPFFVRNVRIQDQFAVVGCADHKLTIVTILTAQVHLVASGHRHLEHLEIEVLGPFKFGAIIIHLDPIRLEADLADIFGRNIVVLSALLIKFLVRVLPGIDLAHKRCDQMGRLAESGCVLRVKPFRRAIELLGLLSVLVDPLHLLVPELSVAENSPCPSRRSGRNRGLQIHPHGCRADHTGL